MRVDEMLLPVREGPWPPQSQTQPRNWRVVGLGVRFEVPVDGSGNSEETTTDEPLEETTDPEVADPPEERLPPRESLKQPLMVSRV